MKSLAVLVLILISGSMASAQNIPASKIGAGSVFKINKAFFISRTDLGGYATAFVYGTPTVIAEESIDPIDETSTSGLSKLNPELPGNCYVYPTPNASKSGKSIANGNCVVKENPTANVVDHLGSIHRTQYTWTFAPSAQCQIEKTVCEPTGMDFFNGVDLDFLKSRLANDGYFTIIPKVK